MLAEFALVLSIAAAAITPLVAVPGIYHPKVSQAALRSTTVTKISRPRSRRVLATVEKRPSASCFELRLQRRWHLPEGISS